jgi:hypothetical protein
MTSIVDDTVSKMKYYFYSGESVWQERAIDQLNDAVVYLAQCLLCICYISWQLDQTSGHRHIWTTILYCTIIVIRYRLSLIQHSNNPSIIRQKGNVQQSYYVCINYMPGWFWYQKNTRQVWGYKRGNTKTK